MPHVANNELSTEEVIETVQNLTDLLFTVFPKTTVYPALGNHDYHPKHLMPPTPNDIYTAVGKLWSRWLPLDAVNTFERGAFCFKKSSYYLISSLSCSIFHILIAPNSSNKWTEKKVISFMDRAVSSCCGYSLES